MLQLQSRKPVPIDPEYLSRKGFDFKKRDMSLTLQMLHNFVTLVTEQDDLLLRKVEPCDTQSRVEKSREEKSRVDTIAYVDFEKSTLAAWNLLCDSYPVLSKVNHISESRRKSLKKRYEQPTFRAFETIIGNIPGQKFLLGENDRGWKVSFDWLIKNDINHIKILEGKYGTDSAEIPEYLRSIIK
jgi:hypothetical protein